MTCIAPGCDQPRSVGAVFCDLHLTAPAGRRGGWLSAERRRRMMGNNAVLDASRICRAGKTGSLWIGGKPPFDRPLPEFDALVLCAKELQPKQVAFQGHLYRCPIIDGYLESEDLQRSLLVGRCVAKELVDGARVLVTCAQGRNRSALVSAFALGFVSKLSADQITEMIRRQRNPSCLSNPHFRELMQRFIGAGRQGRGRRPNAPTG